MKQIKIVLIMVILTGLCSCRKNLLDVQPTNLLTADQIVSNDATITAWFASLYRDLPMEDYSFIEGDFWRFPDGGNQYLANLDDESIERWDNPNGAGGGGTGSYMNGTTYPNIYKAIRNVNSFIVLVSAATNNFNAAQITQYVAEAKFIRAYCYYEQVKFYGGVPLVITVQATPTPLPRNKESEIYDQVKKDLDDAAAGLPAVGANLATGLGGSGTGTVAATTQVNGISYSYGRANKWAALALESRAMLHAGSEGIFSANDGSLVVELAGAPAGTTGLVGITPAQGLAYEQAAFNASQAIINSGVFSLYSKYAAPGIATAATLADYAKNFEYLFYDTQQGNSNSEAILNRGYDYATTLNTHSQDGLVLPQAIRTNLNADHLMPTADLQDKFETIDGSPQVTCAVTGQFYHFPSQAAAFAGKEPRYHGTLISNGTFFKTATITRQNGVILGGVTITNGSFNQFFDTKVGSSGYKTFQSDPTKFPAGDTYVVGTGNSGNQTSVAWLKKWTDPITDVSLLADYKSRTSWMDLRYGEVLLDYAEASFELGHAASESQVAIDKLRARAGLPSIPVSRAVIRHERYVELSYENKTWWDYVRWRALTSDFNNRIEYGMNCYWDIDTSDFVYTKSNVATRTFNTQLYYNNIPATEQTAAGGILVKNPGF